MLLEALDRQAGGFRFPKISYAPISCWFHKLPQLSRPVLGGRTSDKLRAEGRNAISPSYPEHKTLRAALLRFARGQRHRRGACQAGNREMTCHEKVQASHGSSKVPQLYARHEMSR